MTQPPLMGGAAAGNASLATGPLDRWLGRLADQDGELGRLLKPAWPKQLSEGYGHTLREICQQPVTWTETATHAAAGMPILKRVLEEAGIEARQGALVLTGSGSSLYAGECVALPLQAALHVPATAVPAGLLLTHPEGSLPPSGPYLVISLARSGNSPESRAVLDALLREQPQSRHLVITSNREGALATAYRAVPTVTTLILDEKTNDKSLVMTSSFTNIVLAAGVLRSTGDLRGYEARARTLAGAAVGLLAGLADRLAATARSAFSSVVYLGSGCRLGAAKEGALKMLEMNAGAVWTMAESYLGLRHGPMSAIRSDTLVVALLSSEPVTRAYEIDLLRELGRKELGARKVVVGAGVPADVVAPEDLVVDCGDGLLGDADLVLIDALVGQLLSFFRCLRTGLHPDSPSADGIIHRVVSGFEIHRRS